MGLVAGLIVGLSVGVTVAFNRRRSSRFLTVGFNSRLNIWFYSRFVSSHSRPVQTRPGQRDAPPSLHAERIAAGCSAAERCAAGRSAAERSARTFEVLKS